MKLSKIFGTKYGGLVFSLLSGCAYFIIILDVILQSSPNAGLLGFFFCPAIVCGMGLVLFKFVHRLLSENEKKAELVCLLHVILILLSTVFLADLIF